MEYRILNSEILNIEVMNLPEKSGELIFLSLPEGHRFLAGLKSFTRINEVKHGKTLISLWRETDFSLAGNQREDRRGNQARIIGTGGSGMHSERDVRNEQVGHRTPNNTESPPLREVDCVANAEQDGGCWL
jgi:hypothetical protein